MEPSQIYNCLFFDNKADGNGGGIFVYGDEDTDDDQSKRKTDLQLVNCTFSDNEAGVSDPTNIGYGGGVFVNGNGECPLGVCKSSHVKVVGTILYYNTAHKGTFLDRKQIYFDGYTSTGGDDPETAPIFSCIECDRGTQSHCVGDHDSVICYDGDRPGCKNRSMNDYSLATTSDLLDEGCRVDKPNPGDCPNGYVETGPGGMGTIDLNGNPRTVDSNIGCDGTTEIEMGCFERPVCSE